MRLYSADERKSVNVGMGSIWYSVYSTASIAFAKEDTSQISLALDFLRTGECPAEKIEQMKQQLEVVYTAFSFLEPDRAIYDLHKPNIAPPWAGNIAPTVTSCANLYTTAEGKDLFTEVFMLLSYAADKGVSVFAG